MAQEIYDSTRSFDEPGDDVNAFNLEKIDPAKRLIDYFQHFSLWSNIMSSEFDFGPDPASSASVESEYNRLKNFTLRDVKYPLRADEFVKQYLDRLLGRIRIIDAKLNSVAENEEDFMDGLERNIPREPCIICGKLIPHTTLFTCRFCYQNIHSWNKCSVLFDDGQRVCMKCYRDPTLKRIMDNNEVDDWRGKGFPRNKKVLKPDKKITSSRISSDSEPATDSSESEPPLDSSAVSTLNSSFVPNNATVETANESGDWDLGNSPSVRPDLNNSLRCESTNTTGNDIELSSNTSLSTEKKCDLSSL